ncbi:AraC family transcriptional regulator [Agrobacterium tumefaciens]|uniref:AraC family transcriptional regulator n=1 Tax=Agrobacterium tumefaciens TaxID=358 RepID=UPI00287DB195|nr:AraC family transcriptional regulator [Agrobacterium tumefaciens]MDS7596932.1 AraC family transcriptional regulator [Agrobacterium tumefaciens]
MKTPVVDLRTYTKERPSERHGFVQIVLPVSGSLRMDVAGRENELSSARGVFIESGRLHTQEATAINHSLVIDVDENAVSESILDRFSTSPYFDVSKTTRQLVSWMRHCMTAEGLEKETTGLWAPLLIDSFSREKPAVRSRLEALRAIVSVDPFHPWTVETMAKHVDISDSRLHALFIEEFETSPHQWLAALRMEKVCRMLRETAMPIAEIALKAGFSDQTALTRAMRNTMGQTPAAYRRTHQNDAH